MSSRQDVYSLPPRMFLDNLLPYSCKIYCDLWNEACSTEQPNLFVSWENVRRHYGKNQFRTTLRKLLGCGLADFRETDEGVFLNLLGVGDSEILEE